MKLSIDRVILHAVTLVPAFGPAAYAGYKWWTVTEGADRLFFVTAVIVVEVLLAFGLISYAQAKARGDKVRAALLPVGMLLCATLSGVMLWTPVSDGVSNRFPRPVVPDATAAQVELATVQSLLVELQEAVNSGDRLRIQASIAAAGGDLGSAGLDGVAGGRTSAGLSEARASLAQREAAASAALIARDEAKRADTLWVVGVIIGIVAILLIETFGRWLWVGASKPGGSDPKRAAQDNPLTIEPGRTYAPNDAGDPPGQAPEGYHWVERHGAFHLRANARPPLRRVS